MFSLLLLWTTRKGPNLKIPRLNFSNPRQSSTTDYAFFSPSAFKYYFWPLVLTRGPFSLLNYPTSIQKREFVIFVFLFTYLFCRWNNIVSKNSFDERKEKKKFSVRQIRRAHIISQELLLLINIHIVCIIHIRQWCLSVPDSRSQIRRRLLPFRILNYNNNIQLLYIYDVYIIFLSY